MFFSVLSDAAPNGSVCLPTMIASVLRTAAHGTGLERGWEMNPHTFAQRDCANYQTKDGSCLGILVECLQQQEESTQAKPLDWCLLAGKILRPCWYFEKVVLTLADQPSPKEEPDLQRQRLEARQKYLAARKMEMPETVSLRTCPECGGPLAKRWRYCERCTQKRRLATYRQRRMKNRFAAPQLSGF